MKITAISLPSIPVCIPANTRPVRRSHWLVVPPTTFPLIAFCSSNQTIPRLNPLLPPFVQKRTVSLETSAVHHHNQQRALTMQRTEHYRSHQVWRKPFYGTSTEKEEYRRDLREQLKRQMEQKRAALKLQLASEAKEAEDVCEVDRLVLSSEREQRLQRRKAMTAYRDQNKTLMEQRWRDKALSRSQEALKERELLQLNPINWSGTLK